MKLVIRAFLANIFFIMLFTFFYWYLQDHYTLQTRGPIEFIDVLFLSTTVQAGVGYEGLHPVTPLAKMMLIFQQWCMISLNIFILYFFTL